MCVKKDKSVEEVVDDLPSLKSRVIPDLFRDFIFIQTSSSDPALPER